MAVNLPPDEMDRCFDDMRERLFMYSRLPLAFSYSNIVIARDFILSSFVYFSFLPFQALSLIAYQTFLRLNRHSSTPLDGFAQLF